MAEKRSLADRLPYTIPLAENVRLRRVRAAVYVLLIAAFVAVTIQFQVLTVRNYRGLGEQAHKGAVGRWRTAVDEFWEGRNIYRNPVDGPGEAAPGRPLPPRQNYLHPNMPFTVMLLTPFALLPVPWMAITWSLLKVGLVVMALLMAARLAAHHRRRTSDWVVLLGLLWALDFLIGDIQHGNTNVLVLGAICLHLWLYRRGNDFWAAAPLVAAICLKMTPALFLLYWLYQRNWKLLGGAVVFLFLFVVVVPWAALAVAFGPGHYFHLTAAWLDNLILPGLVKGAWYPVHINQSISGVFSRYFLEGQYGDIFWNADDDPGYLPQEKPGWITLVALSPVTVKWMIRGVQLLVVAAMAWAIGWRKLPRDDGRRALHYGLVLTGMMLLNQRTWNHHAAVLLPAYVAAWHALGYGRMNRLPRLTAFALLMLAGPLLWMSGNAMVKVVAALSGHAMRKGAHWADYVKAYGPTFYHFLLLLMVLVILSAALRRKDKPYLDARQPLLADSETE